MKISTIQSSLTTKMYQISANAVQLILHNWRNIVCRKEKNWNCQQCLCFSFVFKLYLLPGWHGSYFWMVLYLVQSYSTVPASWCSYAMKDCFNFCSLKFSQYRPLQQQKARSEMIIIGQNGNTIFQTKVWLLQGW